jgi:hypothetical protein
MSFLILLMVRLLLSETVWNVRYLGPGNESSLLNLAHVEP